MMQPYVAYGGISPGERDHYTVSVNGTCELGRHNADTDDDWAMLVQSGKPEPPRETRGKIAVLWQPQADEQLPSRLGAHAIDLWHQRSIFLCEHAGSWQLFPLDTGGFNMLCSTVEEVPWLSIRFCSRARMYPHVASVEMM